MCYFSGVRRLPKVPALRYLEPLGYSQDGPFRPVLGFRLSPASRSFALFGSFQKSGALKYSPIIRALVIRTPTERTPQIGRAPFVLAPRRSRSRRSWRYRRWTPRSREVSMSYSQPRESQGYIKAGHTVESRNLVGPDMHYATIIPILLFMRSCRTSIINSRVPDRDIQGALLNSLRSIHVLSAYQKC